MWIPVVFVIRFGAKLYRIVIKTRFGNAGFTSFSASVLEQNYIELCSKRGSEMRDLHRCLHRFWSKAI